MGDLSKIAGQLRLALSAHDFATSAFDSAGAITFSSSAAMSAA
jgi:hypothetical protein